MCEVYPYTDCWDDHDERKYGDMVDHFDELLEDFIYSCCEKSGESEDCKIGTHIEKHSGNKRA